MNATMISGFSGFRGTLLVLALALMSSCVGSEKGGESGRSGSWDQDEDGFLGVEDGGGDCDDQNAEVHPGQVEDCHDGVDNDCDDAIDDSDAACTPTELPAEDLDQDGDGYSLPEDCDDNDATVYPGASERCEAEGEELKDDDCGGTYESDDPDREAVGCTLYLPDLDEDGYGGEDEDGGRCTCLAPETSAEVPTWSAVSGDCDDVDPRVNPDAVPSCATEDVEDADCDGDPDPYPPEDCLTWCEDADGDGEGDPAVCECACEAPVGYVGNDDGCALDEMETYYRDADGDDFGADEDAPDGSPASRRLCEAEGVYTVRIDGDCDDDDASVRPWSDADDGIREVDDCGGVDWDCDLGAGEDASEDEFGEADARLCTEFYRDADGDGFGDEDTDTRCYCGYYDDAGLYYSTAPSGLKFTATVGTDCDDASASNYEGATEICDGQDNDCDGIVDNDGAGGVYYADDDNDGYGDPDSGTIMCPDDADDLGYVEEEKATDCDDTRYSVHPGQTESCNLRDDDCDDEVDEGLRSEYYIDVDGDGFGAEDASPESLCIDSHSGYSSTNDDCNDASDRIYPGRTEACNDKDDDCDGSTDEGVEDTYYIDDDEDGYGSEDDSGETRCNSDAEGYSKLSSDCNDASAAIHPYATESCNAVDDDCDDEVDEGLRDDYYLDTDGDLLGNPASIVTLCIGTYAGYVTNGDDCDDMLATVGEAESCWYDEDGDDHGGENLAGTVCPDEAEELECVFSGDDCDDKVATTFPDAEEICDGVDNDCDDEIDDDAGLQTWYEDLDEDGYGDDSVTLELCPEESAPDGYVSEGGDCATGDATLPVVMYEDLDADGYGGAPSLTCTPEDGELVDDSSDCDDADSAVNPDAEEVCDGEDNDCDDLVDDEERPSSGYMEGCCDVYPDGDSDGYGAKTNRDGSTYIPTECTCEPQTKESFSPTDCNDGNNDRKPCLEDDGKDCGYDDEATGVCPLETLSTGVIIEGATETLGTCWLTP